MKRSNKPTTLPFDDDPSLAEIDHALHAMATTTVPSPSFLAAHAQRVERDAGVLPATVTAVRMSSDTVRNPATDRFLPPRFRPPYSWQAWVGLASVAALILAVMSGTFWWAGRPQSVSAAEILQRAIIASNPTTGGPQSFHLQWQETSTLHKAGEQSDTTYIETFEQWVSRPDRWYAAERSQQPTALGHTFENVEISDGKAQWSQRTVDGDTSVMIGALSNDRTRDQGLLTGPRIQSLTGGTFTAQNIPDLLSQAMQCYHPTLEGEARVAGRSAYVVNLGQNSCRPTNPQGTPPPTAHASASPAATSTVVPTPVPRSTAPDQDRLWIDKETFLKLKEEYTTVTDQYTRSSVSEVMFVAYNVAIPDATFAYTPPVGARMKDYRPNPIPQQGLG